MNLCLQRLKNDKLAHLADELDELVQRRFRLGSELESLSDDGRDDHRYGWIEDEIGELSKLIEETECSWQILLDQSMIDFEKDVRAEQIFESAVMENMQ